MKNQKKIFEREVKVLTLTNQLLENKVDLMGNKLSETKKLLDEIQVEVKAMNSEVERTKNNMILYRKEFTEDVNMLKDKVMESQTEIKNCKSHMENSLNEKAVEITTLTTQMAATDKVIQDNKNIISHIENIENIIFCDQNIKRYTKLKWILHNYKYHFDIGMDVRSPVFYTQLSGYSFQLQVGWSGEKKEDLGVYLKLIRGCNYEKALEPFRMQYTFEIPDRNGNKHSHNISYSKIDANRKDFFTIHPTENEARFGFGSKILSMPMLQNYIINDMLTIYCMLEHF